MTPPLKTKRRVSDPLRKGGKPPPTTKTTTATAALATDSTMNTAYNLCISEALEVIMQHDVFTSISTMSPLSIEGSAGGSQADLITPTCRTRTHTSPPT